MKIKEPSVLGIWQKSEWKNRQVWVFEKKIIIKEPPADFGYFKTLKEPPGFMKEHAKTWQFSMWLFDFKNENWEPWLYITIRLSNYLDNLQTKWISPITLGVMNL
jgi:hypothetical protein